MDWDAISSDWDFCVPLLGGMVYLPHNPIIIGINGSMDSFEEYIFLLKNRGILRLEKQQRR